MKTLLFTLIIAFAVSLISGKLLIPLLRRLKAGQQIRDDGPQSHLTKAGTPTMGGIMIMLGCIAACAILCADRLHYMWFAIIGAFAYGIIGLIDDLIIVLKKRSLGLKAWQKIVMQFVFAVLISVYAYRDPAIGSELVLPITGNVWDLGIWYIPFNVFFIMALTNSVNLTDGLDGLAGGVSIVNTITYGIIFVGLVGTYVWAEDMLVFAAAMTGGILGFLRYNSHPAKVFMGDTGAFFIGGALSMIAIVSRTQIFIPLMGLMYLLSSLSCILQVGYFKLTHGKRIFKMAPLHHHFELKGAKETKIVSVYMIITTICCAAAILIFK